MHNINTAYYRYATSQHWYILLGIVTVKKQHIHQRERHQLQELPSKIARNVIIHMKNNVLAINISAFHKSTYSTAYRECQLIMKSCIYKSTVIITSLNIHIFKYITIFFRFLVFFPVTVPDSSTTSMQLTQPPVFISHSLHHPH